MPNRSIAKRMGIAALIMTGSIFLSRVIGFVREIVIAHQAGASGETDVYFAAFTIPDFLNYLLAGGALSITFIPIFARYLAEGREEEGWRAFSIITTIMGSFLIVFIVLGEIFAPKLTPIVAPGFDTQQGSDLVKLIRILLPAQFFFYVGGVLMATQYAKEKFFVPALAPLIYNTTVILGGIFLYQYVGMAGFCWGALVGSFLGNFFIQLVGARKLGLSFKLCADFKHEGFLSFVKLSIPIMLGFSLIFTDEWITKFFGSYLEKASISWLNYSRTLMRIPIGVFGQAAGVASFPFLARLAAERKFGEFNKTLSQALKGVLYFVIPISVLMIVLSRETVYIIFSRTRLSRVDIGATSTTLIFFSIGVFAWGAQTIIARGFYALKDTLTPTVIGSVITLATIPLYWLLMKELKQLGLALTSSIGIIVYASTLYIVLQRRTRSREGKNTILFFLKMIVISAIIGGVGWAISLLLDNVISWSSFLGSLMRFAIISSVGLTLLIILSLALKIEELQPLKQKLGKILKRAFL